MNHDPGLHELRRRRNATARIAEECGISHAAVAQWRHVPMNRLAAVRRVAVEFGVDPDCIKPAPAAASQRAAPRVSA
jgi:transcriptional regulator with XRE-family HTH domain